MKYVIASLICLLPLSGFCESYQFEGEGWQINITTSEQIRQQKIINDCWVCYGHFVNSDYQRFDKLFDQISRDIDEFEEDEDFMKRLRGQTYYYQMGEFIPLMAKY